MDNIEELKKTATPAMKQFLDVKEDYPEHIVLFRMGDFFETFYEDAIRASKELGITLTKRGKEEVPLAGIPYKSLDQYLSKIIEKDIKAVIVEQLEDPKEAKGVVKRGVVKEVTPGTMDLTEYLDERESSYISAAYFKNKKVYVSVADITTSDFFVTEDKNLKDILNKFNPKEVVLGKTQYMNHYDKVSSLKDNITISTVDDRFLNHHFAKNIFNDSIQNNLKESNLKKEEIITAGVLFSYLRKTQKNDLPQLREIKRFSDQDKMNLDRFTQRNLELVRNLYDNTKKDTLINVIDDTITPMGSRNLKKMVVAPLIKKKQIEKRLDLVESFYDDELLVEKIRDMMSEVGDIERNFFKITNKRINPKDLHGLKLALEKTYELLNIIDEKVFVKLLNGSSKCNKEIIFKTLENLYELIDNSIKNDPINNFEKRIIKEGYHGELDELLSISENAREWIKNFEKKEKENTNLSSLKVGYNKVHGYYIEVSKNQSKGVPEKYDRKQTLKNSERYITTELKEKENTILNSKEQVLKLQKRVFNEILDEISTYSDNFKKVVDVISYLDIITNFSFIARKYDYTKPIFIENKFDVKKARHPVVERNVEDFVSNNLEMSEEELIILTGPNMAGKSTYMRQNALIVVMAQVGCYVPCSSLSMPVFDRVFVRMGARDDISSGKSTFLVEMEETKEILDNATEDSFIVIDELGRGTSTFDGISIAWSVAEEISQKIKARCIFATHYHYMNQLSLKYNNVKNYKVIVKEKENEVYFLHKVKKGGADKSFGIEVAKIAGLKKNVITRAKDMQRMFEREANIKVIDEMTKRSNDNKQLNLRDLFG
ncbi:MAG: DNA mismatch repair protein MutS [Candidatus Woesearchaeota archaeon]